MFLTETKIKREQNEVGNKSKNIAKLTKQKGNKTNRKEFSQWF